MADFFENSIFFGVFISLTSYGLGTLLKKKFKLAIFNPLLIAIILTMAVLLIFNVDYEKYNSGAQYISYLLTPATICLAIPLYEQFELLKKNYQAVLIGILSGVITSLCSILAFALIFGFDHKAYVTLLPKSITTAIGIGVTEELGGYISIAVAVIIPHPAAIREQKIARLRRIHAAPTTQCHDAVEGLFLRDVTADSRVSFRGVFLCAIE